jgi:peroxiredoxin
MVELGELEKHYQELAKRNVRIVAVSSDDQETSQATQKKFPHLVVISDAQQSLAKAMQVLHPGMGPHGADTNAPTTFLVDEKGYVRWHYRPGNFFTRLSPEKLLAAVDETWPRPKG